MNSNFKLLACGAALLLLLGKNKNRTSGVCGVGGYRGDEIRYGEDCFWVTITRKNFDAPTIELNHVLAEARATTRKKEQTILAQGYVHTYSYGELQRHYQDSKGNCYLIYTESIVVY